MLSLHYGTGDPRRIRTVGSRFRKPARYPKRAMPGAPGRIRTRLARFVAELPFPTARAYLGESAFTDSSHTWSHVLSRRTGGETIWEMRIWLCGWSAFDR
jgi:hypothetical protein